MSATSAPIRAADVWPRLPLAEWQATYETLHRWTQIVGKTRLALAPMQNHWWQVPLYVTPRGLTTTAIPHGQRTFEIEFDFCVHELHVDLDGGERRIVALEPKSVARFYEETMGALQDLGVDVSINTTPVELERVIPFEFDDEHASYDPGHAELFWRQLVQADRALKGFRSRFIGKVSPVHFFWGGMDLAVTRFSGRTAPDPDAALLDFLQTTYEAAAEHGDWDRHALEDDPARRASPR